MRSLLDLGDPMGLPVKFPSVSRLIVSDNALDDLMNPRAGLMDFPRGILACCVMLPGASFRFCSR
eukprot:2582627-Pyramimonas_sp.AAC.1